jgi:hypothetical protein
METKIRIAELKLISSSEAIQVAFKENRMEELLSAIIERLGILDLKIAQLTHRIDVLQTPPEDASTLDQSYASARQAAESAAAELRRLLHKALP